MSRPMIIAADNSMPAPGRGGGPSLIAVLLEEQSDMSAVERFAKLHEADELDSPARNAQARHYEDLIPLSQPGPGEQYAFRVDLDACSGCKACVAACHQLNGLDDDETWRSVGLLVGTRLIPPGSPYAVMHTEIPILKHVTTACHHCIEPGCLSGCPTRAYDKDPTTGIVRHLDDQCMGCQYCLLMCPYEVPQYRPALGIVRKCDMCRQRLAADEAPACVQSCPNRAISIQIVRRDDAVASATREVFLPDSPDPRQTIPTTTFVSHDAALGALRAADAFHDRPQHAHLSLVAMLCLTQAAVGLLAIDGILSSLAADAWSLAMQRIAGLTAAIVGVAGVHAAMLHLGRPTLAVKAWLGWRTSWLSREVIVFGLWMACVGTYAATLFNLLPAQVGAFARLASIVVGLAGVHCSAMIYAATRRPWWNWPRNAVRFLGTAAVLGLTTAALLAALAGSPATRAIMISAVAAIVLKTIWELLVLRRSFNRDDALARTARLLTGKLRRAVDARLLTACFAALSAGVAAAVPSEAVLCSSLALAAAILGELIERTLFFTAVVPPRMPGGIRA